MERWGEENVLVACRQHVLHDGRQWMVAGLAVCAGAARRHKLTDEQVPFSPIGRGAAENIGPVHYYPLHRDGD